MTRIPVVDNACSTPNHVGSMASMTLTMTMTLVKHIQAYACWRLTMILWLWSIIYFFRFSYKIRYYWNHSHHVHNLWDFWLLPSHQYPEKGILPKVLPLLSSRIQWELSLIIPWQCCMKTLLKPGEFLKHQNTSKIPKKGISFLIFVWFSFFFLHIQYSEWMIFLHQLFIYPFKRVGIKYCWDSTILLSKTNGSAQVALTRFFWLGRKTLPLLGWVSRKCSRGCIQYVWKGSLICLWKRWTYRLKGQHFHHGRWSNGLDHLREKRRQENLKTTSQAGSLWAEFGLVKCSLQDWVIIVHFSWLVDSILFTKVPSTLALVEEYKIYMCHFIFAVLVAYSPIVINIPFEKRDDPSPS